MLDRETLDGASRIWLGETGPGPQARYFRKAIDSDETPTAAKLFIFAAERFHVWVNGHYVGGGPVFHHPHRRPIAEFDLSAYWQTGRNIVAVLVYEPNRGLHNSVPSGAPGLTARLVIGETEIVTDESWRATAQTGRRLDTPKRNWALGPIEVVDGTLYPHGWQQPLFDDQLWSNAETQTGEEEHEWCWITPDVPPLRYDWQPAAAIVGIYKASPHVSPTNHNDISSTFGLALRNEVWTDANGQDIATPKPNEAPPRAGLPLSGASVEFPLVIPNLTAETATVLCIDLGQEYVGQICFECECPNAGVIDIGWSEFLVGERPPIMVKGTSYADRLVAVAGGQKWEPIGFSGGRYIALIMRGFTGSITFKNLGMRTSEPELAWGTGHFESSDPQLNAIFDLCARSVRIGTRETVMDCPTREQAPYIGDGNLVAKWIGWLTGDYRHWRYVVRETFVRQSGEGLLRPALFTAARETLLDYNLLAVVFAEEYLTCTGDVETLEAVLPACRRVFDYFNHRRDGDGLIQIDCGQLPTSLHEWEQRYDPNFESGQWLMLNFVDHPGTGAHNVGEPGINRKGLMAALHALHIVASEAMAKLEEHFGNANAATSLRQLANQTRLAAQETFFCPERKLFVDAVANGQRSPHFSQQTNVWCLWAGMVSDQEAYSFLERLHRDEDPQMARSGPYFWSYTLPLLSKFGGHEFGLKSVRELWAPMLANGATTLWETFSGDELDSWCHPWSGAPLEFILTGVLGLPVAGADANSVILKPRYDLLERAEGKIALPRGAFSIQWEHHDSGQVSLSGTLPHGVTGVIQDSNGQALQTVRGAWHLVVNSKN